MIGFVGVAKEQRRDRPSMFFAKGSPNALGRQKSSTEASDTRRHLAYAWT